jgi:hypothetical protein
VTVITGKYKHKMENIMINFRIGILALSLGLVATTSSASFAGVWGQNHPRRAQVLGRDNNLNQTINQDRGQLGGHYWQLQNRDQSIQRQEQHDAAMNGGHITPQEQTQLNKEENGLNRQVSKDSQLGAPSGQFAENHPRRAEVLHQDASLNNEIGQDYGKLGGHYTQLQNADSRIENQEQRDARINGGYITPGQQQRLNQEESNLQNKINQDMQ